MIRFCFRIILLLRRSTQNIYPTALVDLLPNDFARHNAQLLKGKSNLILFGRALFGDVENAALAPNFLGLDSCLHHFRLVNSLMMHGRNNGKKLMTVRIVKHSFEIIHLLTAEVNI